MSDNDNDNDNPEYDEQTTYPRDAEIEQGPLGRENTFLALRFTALRPRDAQEPGPGMPPGVAALGGGAAAGIGESPVPPDFRQNLVNEYRQRQQAQMPAPPAATPALGGPPQPPLPSPANNWIPIGPSVVRKGQAATRPPVSGRVNGIAIGSGGSRVYVGSANGGVWRSDDGGQTWVSKMEALDLDPTTVAADTLACGAIAIAPSDPNRVYVGTGEPYGAIDSYLGVGPLQSPDGGENWFTEPSAPGSPTLAGSGFYRLAVDPADKEKVVAATKIGLYLRETDGAGGFHWTRKQTGVFTSVVASRTGSTTTFYAARRGGGVFLSTDGSSWSSAGTSFPTASIGNVALAVRLTDPTVVYALVVDNSNPLLGEVWRLDTAGNTWRQVAGGPANLFGPDLGHAQGWYDFAIAVDPNNANRIYLGGSTVAALGEWSGSVYRCAVSSSGSGSSLAYSMVPTYIGAGVHADIHTLEFTPASSDSLWVGCDGGVFFTANATTGATFEARNAGLSTLTMNHLGIHPTEDAVLFCGVQDNGTVRYTGEEVWLHSDRGDGGYAVINWNNPYKVLRTYVLGVIDRATDGGRGYSSWSDVSLPTSEINNALFYAPLVGTPRNPAAPAEAEIVAFGGRRPWISTSFGGGWQSIPSNTTSDNLPNFILSMVFASANKLYVGTISGEVYRFDKSATWTRTAIHASPLLVGPVTGIAVDFADASGNSIYVTLGGNGDYRHIWHYDGTNWQQRSGPSPGSTSSLLDVQHNAIVVDPSHTSNLYVGADIGIWRSTDAGATWSTFSNGLPDTAVLDLELHNSRRLMWAATHGRGVYERTLDSSTASAVELYVRDTQLDLGRRPTTDGLADPTLPGAHVAHWAGPDIKVDVPSSSGTYQTPTTNINFLQFVDTVVDGSGGVATIDPSAGTAINRVYVQVHNRGVKPANNVKVMLLLANASAGLPDLPAGYQANVQAGTPITTTSWRTVGIRTLNDVRVGSPKVAEFDLASTLLPPPASLAGNSHFCVLALVNSGEDDKFTNTETHVDALSLGERKAAHKNLHIVQFVGTLPPATEWIAMLLNSTGDSQVMHDIVLDLRGYAGRVRMLIPKNLKLAAGIEQSVDGFNVGPADGFDEWSKRKLEQLDAYLQKKLFDPEWCKQMAEAINQTTGQPMLTAQTNQKPVSLRRCIVKPGEANMLFIALDHPPNAKPGDAFSLFAYQQNSDTQQLIGGSTYQVEIVQKPGNG